MLSYEREKLIRSLHTKKGREQSGLCLLEGEKIIKTAGDAVEFEFTPEMTPSFTRLVTTDTPQDIAAVAKIPTWTMDDIKARDVIIVLDGVQDPGNVGAILRLCLGFHASLVLIESVDVTNPKVVRSSVGSLFHVPWIHIKRSESDEIFSMLPKNILRLENTQNAKPLSTLSIQKPVVLIAGSEGSGIILPVEGESVYIEHEKDLESLNVGHALAITLHNMYTIK